MKRILITGASGNIGLDLISYIFKIDIQSTIIAGVRNIEKARKNFVQYPQLEYVEFDFENSATFEKALDNVTAIFLLRPPHISNIEKYFKPLIHKIKEKGIPEILFISVQGAEKSSIIPHNKIEKLIIQSGIDYIFLRPSYFMQNLTTTLLPDIQKKGIIILPAGKARFNWIDIRNIAETAAILLGCFQNFKNRAIELTGYENENFASVTALLNQTLTEKIIYINANPFKFYSIKRNEGMAQGMILVMIMLHFLPRFQSEPVISDFYEELTGKKPGDLIRFFHREKTKLMEKPHNF